MSFFFPRLIAQTADVRLRLAAVPQIQDALAGRLPLASYVAYLGEAYHHVRHTVPLMRAAQGRMAPRQARFRAALDDYIAEEAGHETWILNDIRQCGGDPDAVRQGRPREATQRMVDYVYDYIAEDNPMGVFGMVLVLEGASVSLAAQGVAALSASLGLGPDCFSYLSSHGDLDQKHMAFFNDLMDGVDDPDDQAAIIEVAKRVHDLYAGVFEAIPRHLEPANVAQK